MKNQFINRYVKTLTMTEKLFHIWQVFCCFLSLTNTAIGLAHSVLSRIILLVRYLHVVIWHETHSIAYVLLQSSDDWNNKQYHTRPKLWNVTYIYLSIQSQKDPSLFFALVCIIYILDKYCSHWQQLSSALPRIIKDQYNMIHSCRYYSFLKQEWCQYPTEISVIGNVNN